MANLNNNQNSRILKYIKDFGSITQFEAFYELGCSRLSARIYDLKNLGYSISSRNETHKNRYGEKCSVKRYYLEEQ